MGGRFDEESSDLAATLDARGRILPYAESAVRDDASVDELRIDHDVRRYWGTEESPTANLAQNGIVPVITCACGDFGCGGATARVTIGDEVVTWDDFRTANTREPAAGLGPFQFERRAYMAALAQA